MDDDSAAWDRRIGRERRPAFYRPRGVPEESNTVNFSLFLVEKNGQEQPMVRIKYKRKK